MYKILTLNKISPKGLSILNDSYKYSENIQNPDVILVRSASMHSTVFNSNLLAIGRSGAGVNNIPIDKCSKSGIVVFNTPGANANAVKELTIAGLFLSSRKIHESIQWVQSMDSANDFTKQIEKGKSNFKGPEIYGKNLGVIGLGAIGTLVANTAEKLGMKVFGFDPYVSVESLYKLSANIENVKSINEIFKNCDYISMHVPLNDNTKNMINTKNIKSMKDGVRILNFSRAELVNQENIVEAVKSKKISCYITDFPTYTLADVDGIITIPHLGASTPQAEDNCAYMVVKEVKDYLETGNINNSVNFPNISMTHNAQPRLCVLHKNIPGMIKAITEFLAENHINIENMQSKSKNDYAYAMFDISGNISKISLKGLNLIDGIIRLRII